MRLWIIGGPASGKSTLAASLSHDSGVPVVETDALMWGPRWRRATPESAREQLTQALTAVSWIVDGSYPEVEDLLIARCDQLLILEPPFLVRLGRLARRTAHDVITRRRLWNGNRQTVTAGARLLVWAIAADRSLGLARRSIMERVMDRPGGNVTIRIEPNTCPRLLDCTRKDTVTP